MPFHIFKGVVDLMLCSLHVNNIVLSKFVGLCMVKNPCISRICNCQGLMMNSGGGGGGGGHLLRSKSCQEGRGEGLAPSPGSASDYSGTSVAPKQCVYTFGRPEYGDGHIS